MSRRDGLSAGKRRRRPVIAGCAHVEVARPMLSIRDVERVVRAQRAKR